MLTATHINYLHICSRKLWLFSNGLQMESNSALVKEGKLIGENSYPQRSEKYTEVEIGGIKIDFYDAKNRIVHEIKKSDRVEIAHEAQLKYYLYKLEAIGVSGATGLIEYPTLRQTTFVPKLTDADVEEIKKWEEAIERIIKNEIAPPTLDSKICGKCSYYDFCYAS